MILIWMSARPYPPVATIVSMARPGIRGARFLARQVGAIAPGANTKTNCFFQRGDDPRVRATAARLIEEKLIEPILIGEPCLIRPTAPLLINRGHLSCFRRVCDSLSQAPPVQTWHGRRPLRRKQAEFPRRAAPCYFRGPDGGRRTCRWFPWAGGGQHHRGKPFARALACIGPPRPASVRFPGVFLTGAWKTGGQGRLTGVLALADCAMVVDPTPNRKIADIAIANGQIRPKYSGRGASASRCCRSPPKGSAEPPRREQDGGGPWASWRKTRAGPRSRWASCRPDAALVTSVAGGSKPLDFTRGPDERIRLIFPDLNSANIAYKTGRAPGRCRGPTGRFLQGLGLAR